MRLGLLGGTFNPIHRGHLDLAVAARKALALDRVLFVPAHVPPHRPRPPLASAFHRFAMTAIAVLGEEALEASDLELARPGPSFSSETLRALHAEGWRPWQLFFISGIDAFAEVDTWRHFPALLDDGHFVVVSRPGYGHSMLMERLPMLVDRFVDARDETLDARLGGPQTAIVLVDAPTTAASSTDIRKRIAEGQPLHGLVTADVARYIEQHHLYEPVTSASQLHG